MSDFEHKPNNGSLFKLSSTDRNEQYKRLEQFDWFRGLEEEEKKAKTPAASGSMKIGCPACGELSDFFIDQTNETTMGGKPIAKLRFNPKKVQAQPQASSSLSFDQDDDVF